MKRIAITLFALLAATSLFAEPITIHPLAPTSRDAISFHLGAYCGIQSASVSRQGNEILILANYGILCNPPILTMREVKIDPLPPGVYVVRVNDQNDQTKALQRFVVRNGDPGTFEVHPFVATDDMRLHRTDGRAVCPANDCSNVTLRVGGVVVPNIKPAADGAVWFDAPALEPGLLEIEVVTNGVTEKQGAAIYYPVNVDPTDYFERLLFPVLDEVSGVGGSHFVSEVVLANPHPWNIEFAQTIQPIVCVVGPCGTIATPGSYTRFEGAGYPHGVVLWVGREEANGLSASLRVRDTSRVAQGFGTQIPVVREREMARNHPLALLNVPRDPRYRVKIRFYALEPFFDDPVHANVTIVDVATGARTQQSVIYTVSENDPTVPAYAELDLPAGNAGQRSAIYIQPPVEAFAWAFATVTNDDTQQITVITPSGKGEVPCAECREP